MLSSHTHRQKHTTRTTPVLLLVWNIKVSSFTHIIYIFLNSFFPPSKPQASSRLAARAHQAQTTRRARISICCDGCLLVPSRRTSFPSPPSPILTCACNCIIDVEIENTSFSHVQIKDLVYLFRFFVAHYIVSQKYER